MTPFVKRIIQSRKDICQLLVVALFLSLGVNLVAVFFHKDLRCEFIGLLNDQGSGSGMDSGPVLYGNLFLRHV